jgi:hypothetical protein
MNTSVLKIYIINALNYRLMQKRVKISKTLKDDLVRQGLALSHYYTPYEIATLLVDRASKALENKLSSC